jgi:hypothetical protein
MLDVVQTRARFIEWVKSPAFHARFRATHKKRTLLYPVAIALLGVAFLTGRLTGKVEILFVLVIIAMMLILHTYNHGRRMAAARREAPAALQNHVPVLGVVVLGNDSLFGTKGVVAPALFLGCFDTSDENTLERLGPTASALADLHGKDPANYTGSLQEACRIVNDDSYRADRRRRLPQGLVEGNKLWLFDLMLVSEDLPAPDLRDSPYLVCMASPGESGSIIQVPSSVPVFTEQPYDPNIIVHQERATPPPLVAPVSENLDAIDAHISRHLGEVSNVFHEIVSAIVHVDIHIVPATPERPWISLVTSGMSDIPMNAPENCGEYRFAELMMRLPPDWKLSEQDFQKEENYWPIRTLKFLARFPHEYETWLCYGHTIPNGNPPSPFAADIPFNGVVLAPPGAGGKEFPVLRLNDGTPVHFWSLVPLHPSEMDYKLEHGADALFSRLEAAGHSDLVDPGRAPVA